MGDLNTSMEVSTSNFDASTPTSKPYCEQLDLSMISDVSLELTPHRHSPSNNRDTTMQSMDLNCSECLSDSFVGSPSKGPDSGLDTLNTPKKMPTSDERPGKELPKSGSLKPMGPDSSSPSQQAAKSALGIMAVVAGYISTPTKTTPALQPLLLQTSPARGDPQSTGKMHPHLK